MYSFQYQKAKSVDDAAKVILKNADAKLLAGGQSLIAAMKLRLSKPSDLVDISGVKGCGEAGAIGAPAAVMNALTDALGTRDIEMPATPQRIWRACRDVKKAA